MSAGEKDGRRTDVDLVVVNVSTDDESRKIWQSRFGQGDGFVKEVGNGVEAEQLASVAVEQ